MGFRNVLIQKASCVYGGNISIPLHATVTLLIRSPKNTAMTSLRFPNSKWVDELGSERTVKAPKLIFCGEEALGEESDVSNSLQS